MGLTVVTGPANAGKTGVLHEALVPKSNDGMPVLLLPQAPDVRRAQREFAMRGVMGVRVAVLDDWIAELWGLHGDGRRIVGPAARNAILADVISNAQLDEVALSARSPGFVRLMSELARDLTQLQPDPHDVVAAELAAMLQGYTEALRRQGLIEYAHAAAILACDPPPVTGPIAVNRFTDLSQSQETFLVALSKVTDVTMALPWRESSASTEALDPLVARLRAVSIAHTVVTESAWTDEGLVVLEERLFEGREPVPVPAGVVFGEAAGVEAECALAARLAREALDDGRDPGDMVIAFRNLAARVNTLVSALRAEDIDSVVDVSVAFEKTPFGTAFLSLVTACQGAGDTRERLLAFLLSPYCRVRAQDVAALDVEWRRRRIRDADLVPVAREALPDVETAIRRACALVGRTIDAERAMEWKLLADELLAAGHLHRGLDDSDALYDVPAHGAVLRVVGELVELLEPATDSGLVSALQEVSISAGGREDASCVLITEAHRLKGRRFGTVILGGLNADEFAPPRNESLADSLAARLGEPRTADSALGERLLFYMMVTRAHRQLVMIRQASSEEGEPTRASAFWEEVLDVYRTPEETASGALPSGLDIRRLEAANLAASAPALLPNRRRLRDDPTAHAPVPPRRGVLSDAAAEQMLASREEFSVSEIETYVACPYAWFFRYGLRAREIDSEFDARERGSRAHDILRRFYGHWHEAGKGRVCADDVVEALELLDRAAAERHADPRSMGVSCLEDELSTAKAQAWARNVVLDDVGFLPGLAPARHELRFGARHDVPVDFFGVALSGSIDRVDVSDAGLVVIDYKSSSTLHGHKSFAGKGLMQVAVYAAIAAQLLERPVIGGVYRSMRTLGCRGFWDATSVDLGPRGSNGDMTDAEGIDAIIRDAGERLSEAVQGMRAGSIAPRPLGSQACTRCDARIVCREAQ